MADNQEVFEAATAAAVVAQEVSEPVDQVFTADDLAKARAQEKSKLYPQMEKMAKELEALKKAQEDEVARKAAHEQSVRELEEQAKKSREEEELSAKELLAKKEQEFIVQLDNERLEREKAFALLHKEQEALFLVVVFFIYAYPYCR